MGLYILYTNNGISFIHNAPMSVPKFEADERAYVPKVELGEQRVKSTISEAYRHWTLHQMSRSRFKMHFLQCRSNEMYFLIVFLSVLY